MPETLVENRTCRACGVDVRKGALFCYNCGGSVAPEMPPAENHNSATSDAWFRESIAEEISQEGNFEAEKPETAVAETKEASIKKTGIYEDARMKSAASLRRKSKVLQKRRVEEVIWEEHENAPNGWFILVALVLTLFAVGIFWLATYLK